MTDKESLLRRIGALDFAVWELHIYLDTHPYDENALKMYDDYVQKSIIAKEEYSERFGGLYMDMDKNDKWSWVEGPWPWEKDANGNGGDK